jgi:hypothetical protein
VKDNFHKQLSGRYRTKRMFCTSLYSVLFLLFSFVASGTFASSMPALTDTTKKNFPLNDPRNPDCPCHKFQKIADDEYKEMQKKENRKEEQKKGPTKKEVVKKETDHPGESGNENSEEKRKRSENINGKRQQHGKCFYKAKSAWSKKFSKRFRSKKDPSSCFHWT